MRVMREKDHSPRKMLPSPKQGCVYPALGLVPTSYISHVPYELASSLAATSSSSSSSSSPTTTTTTAAGAGAGAGRLSSQLPHHHHSSHNHHHHHQLSHHAKGKRRSSFDQPLDLRLAHKRKTEQGPLEDENSNLIVFKEKELKELNNNHIAASLADLGFDMSRKMLRALREGAPPVVPAVVPPPVPAPGPGGCLKRGKYFKEALQK